MANRAWVGVCLSLVVGLASSVAAEPASHGDAVITPVTEQPKRSAQDAARVAAAEKALLQAAASARSASTLQAACRGAAALDAALGELDKVRPPAGFEHDFAEGRDGLAMELDHVEHVLCTDPHPDPSVIMDVEQWLGRRLRRSFGRLQRIGKAPVGSPEARGRAVLDAQLDALDDDARLAATFAPKAFVLTPSSAGEVGEIQNSLGSIADLNPHAEIDSVTFDHFVSGSTGGLAWFAVELHIQVTSHEPEYPPSTSTQTVRAIELLDGADKVAVAAFTRVGAMNEADARAVVDATGGGPLTKLLLSPPALAVALGDHAVVLGTDPGERGLGTKGARALLAKWKQLTITLDAPAQVHEVDGTTFGYAMANVRVTVKPGGPAYKLSAFVLALPLAGSKWSVVGASYGER